MSSSTNTQVVTLASVKRLRGALQIPGDKSISHRSALFAALGAGASRLMNYSSARDCQSTLDCLAALGVNIRRTTAALEIDGVGCDGLRAPTQTLDVGNSGTTIRLLSGILAGQPFTTDITGDESIQRRPMKRVIEPLTLMGARITARAGSYAPLRIAGGNLQAIEYRPPVASAQVKSCVLLAGLFAAGETAVLETTPTRNHTEVMLRECGITLQNEQSGAGQRLALRGGQSLKPLGDYTVAGDLSSAAFFLVAAMLAPEAEVRLNHIGINPSRSALIDVLRQMGGQLEVVNQRLAHGEPVADLIAGSSKLKGELALSGAIIANLIDELPILAVAATQLDGMLTVRDARELRVKESDRIHAIVENLRRMQIEVAEFEDGFAIKGKQPLRGARVDSFGDHRIAMAFAVAGLAATGETQIVNAEAAAVSLPEFYQLLAQCGANVGQHE